MSQFINQIRFYHYLSGVLSVQQSDPFCGACRAYANTLSSLRDALAKLEDEQGDTIKSLSGEMPRLLKVTRVRAAALTMPENAIGQKKAGNCGMPEGVCFVKVSKGILEKI